MANAPLVDDDLTPTPAPPPSPSPSPAPNADDPSAPTPSPAPSPAPDADDFRTRFAGGDEKVLAWLGRYPTEADFAKDAKKRYDEVRGGKFLKPLGDDPSASDVAAYRDAMGVPDKPEGYLEKLSGGLVVGEDDKPVVDKFLAAMHEKNAPAAVTDAALQTYYKIVEEQNAAIATAVAEAKVACEDTLREEYGADFRRNTTAADSYLETQPAELQTALSGGFNAAGIPLKSDANVMKWLVQLALDANPLATVVPGSGANQASAIAEEIAKIEGLMRTDRSAYNKDTGMQQRYRDLITARDKLPKDG